MNVAIRQEAEDFSPVTAPEAPAHRFVESAAHEVPFVPWHELERQASEPNVFLGREFALAYADAFGLGERLRALRFADEAGRLDGLFLYRRGMRWGLPIGVTEGLMHSFAATSAPLVREGCEQSVAAGLVEALKSGATGDRVWLLPFFPSEGPLAEALLEASGRAGVAAFWFETYDRPVLEPGAADPAEFAVTDPGRFKKYRRLGRQLARSGELAVETVREPENVEWRLATFLEMEAAGWKGRLGTAAALNPAHDALFRAAVPALAARGQCRIDTLLLDGTPIACGIVLESAGACWFWKVAYDEAHAKHSPYIQLLMRQTQDIVERAAPRHSDSCTKPGLGPVDQFWHQRRGFGDLMLVPEGGLPGPHLAAFLERTRRAGRETAVGLRNAVRTRLTGVRTAPAAGA